MQKKKDKKEKKRRVKEGGCKQGRAYRQRNACDTYDKMGNWWRGEEKKTYRMFIDGKTRVRWDPCEAGRGLYWWEGLGKMQVGARLWSCGDALSVAEIWGSDSRLVFLLHNQCAVWIPLHISLNMYSQLDPAKSLPPFPHSTDFYSSSLLSYWLASSFLHS